MADNILVESSFSAIIDACVESPENYFNGL